ncbi:MAG: Spy/CpxP family protein refolding chaperone [Candidatus Acidiferrales bacterium]
MWTISVAMLLLPVGVFAQRHECPQQARHVAQGQHQSQAQNAYAAQAPVAVSAEAGHHAFLKLEREAIENGQGFGMALAADRNGYPGPQHILELKDALQLTPQQDAAVTELMSAMKQKALARGREILAAEQRLEEMFRAGRPEAELREETYRIARLRAQLRWVHLETHIAARKLLSAEQLAAYQQLRHGGGEHAHGNE